MHSNTLNVCLLSVIHALLILGTFHIKRVYLDNLMDQYTNDYYCSSCLHNLSQHDQYQSLHSKD